MGAGSGDFQFHCQGRRLEKEGYVHRVPEEGPPVCQHGHLRDDDRSRRPEGRDDGEGLPGHKAGRCRRQVLHHPERRVRGKAEPAPWAARAGDDGAHGWGLLWGALPHQEPAPGGQRLYVSAGQAPLDGPQDLQAAAGPHRGDPAQAGGAIREAGGPRGGQVDDILGLLPPRTAAPTCPWAAGFPHGHHSCGLPLPSPFHTSPCPTTPSHPSGR
mmetsp:Transcript_97830/g.258381  ORF Transcript_97830/g.258381 Transcript_97830/m.258381 type:complete len:214 (+) Transcript_97830:943-1584(+)